MKTPFAQWSALLPLALSLAALALIWFNVLVLGVAREADEGTAAHLWQLLMAAQVPLIAFFALTWLPRTPMRALVVLAVQILVVVANFASLRYFDL